MRGSLLFNNRIMEKQEYNYIKIDKKIDQIVKKASLCSKEDFWVLEEWIKKSYIYARDAHEGQFRHSGDPYILHPVEATDILMELKPDLHTIQACLLHDVIEDTPKTYDDIKQEFWDEVAYLCSWMEKLSKVKYKWEERTIWSLRKMFVAMSEDLRVIFIKLSDRLHNMKTLKYHPKAEKQQRIALETLNIYAPIADRLWLHQLKNLLEEECFKILSPYEYKKLKKQFSSLSGSMKEFKYNAKQEIDNLLSPYNIDYSVEFRVKSIYSIYNKIKKKKLDDMSDLYDIYWIKILVWDVATCYKVLWIIHNKWTPIPKRIKDYIALPKPNWYQSIHTTIIWLLEKFRKQPTEIQIKTYEMNLKSNIWVAAHFEYKEKWSKVAKDIYWVQQLKELTSSLWNNDFIDSLQIDLFKDRIFVLTPNWDTINLPAWSTPIDFAYEIHTDIWNHISAAKVNWTIFPIDKELKNGDIIEVLTDKNKKPNPFYISVVKTIKAKNNIRAFLKREDADLHFERGKQIFNNLLEKVWLEKLDKDFTMLKQFDWRVYNVAERKQLLEQFWSFATNPSAVLRKVLKTKKIRLEEPHKKWENPQKWKITENVEKLIVIWWEKNIPYKVGSCCKDHLSDKIVAYISSKQEVIVHNKDCKVLKRLPSNRMLYAFYEWDEDHNIVFDLDLKFINKIWMLAVITTIASKMNLNILEINTITNKLHETTIKFVLETNGQDYLVIDRFLERLKFSLWEDLTDFKINQIKDR